MRLFRRSLKNHILLLVVGSLTLSGLLWRLRPAQNLPSALRELKSSSQQPPSGDVGVRVLSPPISMNTSQLPPQNKSQQQVQQVPPKVLIQPPTPNPPLPLSKQQANCKQPHCSELLSAPDKQRQKTCLAEISKQNRGVSQKELASRTLENDCIFMDGKKRNAVALTSSEGSGNTWIRGLLERATGICTGFNFCDFVMRMKGFIGENINTGSVLVVKTHMDTPNWTGSTKKYPNKFEGKYGSCIFLVRNPHDALIAEWNRRLTNNVLIKKNLPHNESHTNVAPKEIWFSDSWNEFLHTYMTQWTSRITKWVLANDPTHPVLVVRYEDLKQDTVREIERMLDFLHIPYNKGDLPLILAADFNTFKRPHNRNNDFEHYTSAQKVHMKSTLMNVINLTQEKNMTHLLRLTDYLSKF